MPVINIISIRSWWDLHNSWLGLVLSLALTGTITNLVKVTAGRPRPDLISRCQPMARVQNAPVFGLVTADICTQTDFGILKDGFRSFFSGHSSLSFAGLGFLFFYTAGKLHLFDHRGHAGKAWIAFIPLVGATLIAITRTMDYRHHPVDVLVGSVVGLVIAHFCYRQYYPSLMHPLSHRPYSPRIPRDEVEETPVTKQADAPQAGPSAPWGTGLVSNAAAETGMEPGPDDTVQRGNTELEKVWKTGSNGDDTVPRPAERQGQGRV
ncbi:hypothetical protein FRB99_000892 [Tulasnella sp. 403]|nr:hypothetical protein FRB99_000892 [Tulasnella sp. 403]